MSRRIAAPLLLLLAAACSLAAVFAVHRIEASGGPVSEPFASPYFSPALEGNDGKAFIRFTTHETETITVRVTDKTGRTVRTIINGKRVKGGVKRTWDGRDASGAVVPDGTYRVRITRAGDPRVYEPARPTVVDTAPPRAYLDRASVVDGELRGLVVLEEGETVRIDRADGSPLSKKLRRWFPNVGTEAARTLRPVPTGRRVMRFSAPIDLEATPLDTIHIVAVDAAQNELDLRALPRAPRIEVVGG